MPPTILLKSKLYYKIEQITIIIKTLMTKYNNNCLFECKGILIKVGESFKPLVNKLKTNDLPVYYDLVKLKLNIK